MQKKLTDHKKMETTHFRILKLGHMGSNFWEYLCPTGLDWARFNIPQIDAQLLITENRVQDVTVTLCNCVMIS